MATNKMDELLNILEHLLTKGKKIPLSGGRAVVCVSELLEVLEEVRENLPSEIRIASDITEREEAILENAKKSVQLMVQKAEEKASLLINGEEITQKAREKAQDIINEAMINARDIRRNTYQYLDELLNKAENGLLGCLNDVRGTKNVLKNDGRKDDQVRIEGS
jgi:organic radical activating enzyme